MAKAGTLTAEDIARLKDDLKAAPPPPRKSDLTKIEAVRMLLPEIERLQGERYTLQDIADLLSAKGLTINGPTLSSYLAEIRAKAKSRSKSSPQAQHRPRGEGARSPAPRPGAVAPQAVAHGASKKPTEDTPKPVPSASAVTTVPGPVSAPRGTFIPAPDTPDL